MAKLYYTPPTNEEFNELKEKAIEIWELMGNAGGYSDQKISRVRNIGNIQDNFMYMVAMFDTNNQMKLASKLSDVTSKAVRDRMIDGGNPEHLIPFK